MSKNHPKNHPKSNKQGCKIEQNKVGFKQNRHKKGRKKAAKSGKNQRKKVAKISPKV